MAEIEIRALHKAFDSAVVLKGVDLTIEDGEFISLVGPSGCGKSTLLRIIAGLEPQSSGEIWIDGVSADGVRPSARNLAMVFQSYALYPHLSVFDNIAVPLRMKRLSALQRAPLVGRLMPGCHRTERVIREDVERVAAQHPAGTSPERPAHWGGYRVAPQAFEFWQGRHDRLHDRFRYSRSEDRSWDIERLQP